MLKDKIHITHLIFSGGGLHGAVLVGGMRFLYLEGLHKSITHISCCSVSTFMAVMFAFKFTIKEMEDTIVELSQSEKFTIIPKANYLKIFSNLGLTSTKCITDALVYKIVEKYPEYSADDIENMTFTDIAKCTGINLYISTTCLNTCKLKIFSIEDTPDAKVIEVCRASMSIPFLYQPVLINGEYYIDGGMTNNFPVDIFANVPDENKLGLALLSEKEMDDSSDTQEDKSPTFMFVLSNVATIIRNIVREKVFLSHLNKDCVLKYENIPSKWFNYAIQKRGLKIFIITPDEANELFIYGFHHMMLYMNEREQIADRKMRDMLDRLDIRVIQEDTNKNDQINKDMQCNFDV